MKTILAAAAALFGMAAAAPPPSVDFSGVDDNLAGGPTRVLVLGTDHLAGRQDDIPLEDLSLLLTRLEDYGPDIIAIEGLPGMTCDHLRRFEAVYGDVWERYCPDPEPALTSLGMTAPEASAALEEALSGFSDEPEASERRRIAALFFASGDPYSALVQWYHLPPEERRTGDGIDEGFLKLIEERTESRNENNVLGAVLAQRLGHEQVFPMDDHTADIILARAPEDLWPTIQEMWADDSARAREAFEEAGEVLGSPEGLLEYYRILNSERMQELAIAADFGKAAVTTKNDNVTRNYLAWWQARGLRMAANVIEAAGNRPGAKVLVIVGASHKAYFEAYLDQMHDIELVEVNDILAD